MICLEDLRAYWGRKDEYSCRPKTKRVFLNRLLTLCASDLAHLSSYLRVAPVAA